jgi:hypothetical protein
MPVYVSCYIYPIHAAGDFPFFHGGPGTSRSQAATNMLVDLYHWVRSHHPYWDRRHGKDHLLVSCLNALLFLAIHNQYPLVLAWQVITHDEGSCYVPAVLRNSTVLANWGYAGLNNESFTSYWDDVFTREWKHPVWQPEGHLSKIGNYVCHDPSKVWQRGASTQESLSKQQCLSAKL